MSTTLPSRRRWRSDGRSIAGWPAHYLVIADEGGDPLCLDLSQVAKHDAPVLYAMRGTGRWDFAPYCASFMALIAGLAAS